MLLDINPTLSTANTSVVVGNQVNGYPMSWALYSIPITGVTGTVTGRFAFRYFVNDGGSTGANSRLVGLDAVKYTLPCGATAPGYTTCASAAAGGFTLNATGGISTTTYSWNTGSTSSSIAVNPSSSTVYTLTTSINNGVVCGSQTVGVNITPGNQFPMTVNASTTTICAGQPVVLTAANTANSYNWALQSAPLSPISTNAVITVTPTSTTAYVVGGQVGLCIGSNTITINVNPNPQPTVAISPVCVGGTFAVTVSGAATYTYNGSSTNPQTFPAPTVPGPNVLQIGATGANGCTIFGAVGYTANSLPVISITPATTIYCVNRNITLTSSGAATYTWSGAGAATTNTIGFSTGATAGTKVFTVTATSPEGCVGTAVRTISVNACTGIENIAGNSLATVFPNPFNSELKISGLEGRAEIFNAVGQLVISAPISLTESINTSELAKGVYILKIYNSANEVDKTIKLLKN